MTDDELIREFEKRVFDDEYPRANTAKLSVVTKALQKATPVVVPPSVEAVSTNWDRYVLGTVVTFVLGDKLYEYWPMLNGFIQ